MATPTYAELIAAYPELTTADADEQTTIGTLLEVTTDIVGDKGFKTAEKVQRARLALGAHLTVVHLHRTIKHGGAGIGAVAGRTLSGGQSVSYAQVQGYLTEGVLLTTRYGSTYAQMQRANIRRLPRVSGMSRRS